MIIIEKLELKEKYTWQYIFVGQQNGHEYAQYLNLLSSWKKTKPVSLEGDEIL